MVNSGHGFEQRPAPIGSEELCEAVFPVSMNARLLVYDVAFLLVGLGSHTDGAAWQVYQHVIECFSPQRCMFGASPFCVSTEAFFHRSSAAESLLGEACLARALRLAGVAESNFPPDKECVSHRVLYNCFKRIANK